MQQFIIYHVAADSMAIPSRRLSIGCVIKERYLTREIGATRLAENYTMVREQNALFVSKCPVREKNALPMMHQAVTFC